MGGNAAHSCWPGLCLIASMLRIDRILCPIDLSDAAEHVLNHATALARWYKAPLTVLHVHTPIYFTEPTLAVVSTATGAVLEAGDEKDLLARVGRIVRTVVPPEVHADVVVEDGPAVVRILEQVAASHADVIVLGTRGLTGFEHFLVGSVTEKVLRRATCPVLTIPPHAQSTSPLPFKRLLCPIDFSEASLAAVRVAFELARESDAHIALLSVADGTTSDPGMALQALIPLDATEWCEPTTLVTSGKAASEILRIAELDKTDLIVMGVYGRNALDLILFGSTTNQVVRHALCPVFTIMAPGGRQEHGEPDVVSQLRAMAP
jgi:nucleotide-binding universal stress UspA family protein